MRLSGGGEGTERLAVKGAGGGEDDRAACARADELDRRLDRLGAGGREDTAGKIPRRESGERVRQRLGVRRAIGLDHRGLAGRDSRPRRARHAWCVVTQSEEHTSELQSPCNLVCRLLLEKKKKK